VRKPTNLAGFYELEKAVTSLSDPVPDGFAREFQLSTVYTSVGDEFINRAVEESLRLPARVWKELAGGMIATQAAVSLGRSGIPTLVVRGEKDAWVTAEETDSLAMMVATKRQKTYANTGHAVHWERPAEFASEVVAFRKETQVAAR
jgi:non-heme chloroperoxidase